jgi:rubredoxin
LKLKTVSAVACVFQPVLLYSGLTLPEKPNVTTLPVLMKKRFKVQSTVVPSRPSSGNKTHKELLMERWICTICQYVYDPALGDPDRGIAPGTSFEELPDDWSCPLCGAGKDVFEKE